MSKLHFYSLWSINGALDQRRLCEQVDAMKSWGLDGVVFHPRFYPNVPPYLGDEYLAILSHVILHAKAVGMEFWLYDENGWPSGTVGGELLKQHPDVQQQWLDLCDAGSSESLSPFEHDGRQWFPTVRKGPGVDYLNRDLAQYFLQMTHERYRMGLHPTAFEYVTTFFCDEPEFGLGHAFDALSPHGAIPWTSQIVEQYRQRCGEDLLAHLPLLFFERDGYRKVRVQFWELLTDIFCDAFIAPINRWCQQHGKRFTAHVKGEEHPLFQVPTHGSGHQVFQHLSLPGIDALERYPSGHFFPRQVASAAQQFGNGDCMVECFGGAGWGATPEDLQRYLIWLVGHGLNQFVLHLNQYQLSTHAIQDWPASIPAHVTWRDALPELLKRVKQHAAAERPQARILLVAPYRGIMEEFTPQVFLLTNIHNASTYPPTAAGRINTAFLALLAGLQHSGVPYHISDERSVEQHATLNEGKLRMGHCRYEKVIVAQGVRFDERTARLIEQFSSEPPPISKNESPPTKRTTVDCPVQWEPPVHRANLFVLEAQHVGNSMFSAFFDAMVQLPIEMEFAEDDVVDVCLNGIELGVTLTANAQIGRNELRFKCPALTPTPFVAIRGRFAVSSRAPFSSGPNNTVKTEGPFFLHQPANAECSDLIASGFPFCDRPLTVRGSFNADSTFRALSLTDIAAACAKVFINQSQAQWCWGPDWTVKLPTAIGAGRHLIEVQLIPTTFNRFGPHRHIDGDPHVVSPMQYEYTRNFADRPDAPPSTRVTAWHFKPLHIGTKLLLV